MSVNVLAYHQLYFLTKCFITEGGIKAGYGTCDEPYRYVTRESMKSRIEVEGYEKHIDRDIDMRKLAHYFQDKSILYELGQQRCYDEQSDFLNWSYYSKIQSIVIQAIKDVWTALVQPAQNMEACYIPTVADTKQIISTTLYDIITDGCKPGECERIGLSPALFFDQMFHH